MSDDPIPDADELRVLPFDFAIVTIVDRNEIGNSCVLHVWS